MRKKGGYTCLFLIKECNFCQYYSIVVKNIDFCWTFFYFFALKNSKKSKIMKKPGIYYCMFDQKNSDIQVYSIVVKKLFIFVSKLPQYFVQLLAKDVRILCKILRLLQEQDLTENPKLLSISTKEKLVQTLHYNETFSNHPTCFLLLRMYLVIPPLLLHFNCVLFRL